MSKPTADDVIDVLVATRRRRLKELIDKDYEGAQARFVDKIGANQGEVSGLLRNKHFGEKKARKLEELAGLPFMWLDRVYADNITTISAREPDTADQIAAVVRQMSPAGQYVTLGQVQQLVKQYPAADLKNPDS